MISFIQHKNKTFFTKYYKHLTCKNSIVSGNEIQLKSISICLISYFLLKYIIFLCARNKHKEKCFLFFLYEHYFAINKIKNISKDISEFHLNMYLTFKNIKWIW